MTTAAIVNMFATFYQYCSYDFDRPDPRYSGYNAKNYYRNDRRYRERRLGDNDRVYRGREDKYCGCRSDGSTGLFVSSIAGGVISNVIASGRSETLGTVVGALAGAAAGARNRSQQCALPIFDKRIDGRGNNPAIRASMICKLGSHDPTSGKPRSLVQRGFTFLGIECTHPSHFVNAPRLG